MASLERINLHIFLKARTGLTTFWLVSLPGSEPVGHPGAENVLLQLSKEEKYQLKLFSVLWTISYRVGGQTQLGQHCLESFCVFSDYKHIYKEPVAKEPVY